MPFCENCGKQLADNEVCNCQQVITEEEPVVETVQIVPEASVASENIFKKLWKTFVNVSKTPTTSAPEVVKEGNVGLTLLFIGAYAILQSFYAAFTAGNWIWGIVSFFLAIFTTAISIAAYGGLFLASFKILKTSAGFKNVLGVMTVKIIAELPLLAIAVTFGLIGLDGLAGTIVGILPVLSMLFVYVALEAVDGICKNKRIYVVFGVVLAVVLAASIWTSIWTGVVDLIYEATGFSFYNWLY